MTLLPHHLSKLAGAVLVALALGSIGCSSPAMRPSVPTRDRVEQVTPAESSCAGELCFPYQAARTVGSAAGGR